MTLQECKVGAKVWYYPSPADKTKRKKGTIYTAPAYMWGDWACMITCASGFVNIRKLELR